MKYTFYQALFLILIGSAHLYGGEQKTIMVKINNCSTTTNLYCTNPGLVAFRIPHKKRTNFKKPSKPLEPVFKTLYTEAPTVLQIMKFSELIKNTYAIPLDKTTKITITHVYERYLHYKDQHGTVHTAHQVPTNN